MVNDIKIDLVIPFVNGNDPTWYNEFLKHKKKFNPSYMDGNFKTRYDGDDILLYVFRSVAKYAPWINKIHLLLSGPTQIPDWIDTNKVHIVYHKNFIHKYALPCFNSSVIEYFVWNVPELSEYFIYGNDDFIFNSVVNPSDFFKEQDNIIKCKNTVKYGRLKIEALNTAYFSTFVNSAKLATIETDIKPCYSGLYLACEHDVKCCSKSQQQRLFFKYEQQFKNSVSTFREEYNFNGYFFVIYDSIRNEPKIESERRYKYCPITKQNMPFIKQILKEGYYQTLSLNDMNLTTVDDKMELKRILDIKFPTKCKYEK